MNLYVPELGSKLILTEDWSFILQDEYRNDKLYKNLELTRGVWQNPKNYIVTIPKGTYLTPRRVYIRQGASAYSSITFSIAKKESPDKRFWGVRFFVSLNDANQIKFDLTECNEELLKAVDSCLYDIKEKFVTYKYGEIEKIILESRNINNFRPTEEGFIFFFNAIKRVKEKMTSLINYHNPYYNQYNLNIEDLEEVLKIMNQYFRKFKIAKMISDSEEEEVNIVK